MLEAEEYLDLVKEYVDKYYGAYFKLNDRWVKLVEVSVDIHTGVLGRASDAVIDEDGNLWWIKDELEIAMAAGKIKRQPDIV